METPLIKEFDQLQSITQLAIEFLVNYSFQVLGALIILTLGFILSRKLSNILVSQLEKRNVDITLRTYSGYVVYLLVLFCFIVIALGKFGITIAPFVAALGALTVVAGLALQGLVSNYAAGIAIIATRPFKVGDTITVIGVSGVVKEIRLTLTLIDTEDDEQIMIPNKHIVGEVLLNTFNHRLVESSIRIAYNNDPHLAISSIQAALAKLDYVTQKPCPQVGIGKFSDSAMEIVVRAWVPTKSYMENRFKLNAEIFRAIKSAGLTIPYPQVDIHQK